MKNHSSLHIDQHKQSFRNGVFQQNRDFIRNAINHSNLNEKHTRTNELN